MPSSEPRLRWHSSMIVTMYSAGASTVARTTGSKIWAIYPSGNSLGWVTVSSSPDSRTTR
jgi:hypothetical protein